MTNHDSKPVIAVTMGDPAGVGPEICLDLLADSETCAMCQPLIFGDLAVLRKAAETTGKPMVDTVVRYEEWLENPGVLKGPGIVDFHAISIDELVPGEVSAATGHAAFRYITGSIDAAMKGLVGGAATAPIHKEALRASGVPYPGHTEIYAELSGAKRACMMLTSELLTCSFVTTHIGYRDVPDALSVERILDVIELTAATMRRLRKREPKLVINGLNPHAGEHGLFGGGEEETFIIPAMERARAKGITIDGPLPPDTAFLPARRKQTDAYVCMYHDQGHIPLKMLAFDSAINTTLGLPMIRTSVDHGTALDIAWQGKADSASLILATKLAADLSGDPQE